MAYTKTNWVDQVTPLSAANMNKIENGISELFETKADTDEFVYQKIQLSSRTLGTTSTTDFEVITINNIANYVEGYTPFAIGGFDSGSIGVAVVAAFMNGTDAIIALRNISGAETTILPAIYIIFKKN